MIVKDKWKRMKGILIPESNLREVSRRTGISYNKLRKRREEPESITVAELVLINKAYPIGADERMEALRRA